MRGRSPRCGPATEPSSSASSSTSNAVVAPVDFPIPIAPGAVEIRDYNTQLHVFYRLGDRSRLTTFYDEWVATQPEEYVRVDEPANEYDAAIVAWSIASTNEKLWMVHVTEITEDGSEPMAFVTLTAR